MNDIILVIGQHERCKFGQHSDAEADLHKLLYGRHVSKFEDRAHTTVSRNADIEGQTCATASGHGDKMQLTQNILRPDFFFQLGRTSA